MVIAIIIIISAIAYPIIVSMRATANKAYALGNMRSLSNAIATYANQHDGQLPDEDGQGKEDWRTIGNADQEKAWYNVLPRQMQLKAPADYVKEGRTADFYKKDNILFLPGAQYDNNKKIQKPLFAIAINGRLQRKDKDGKKNEVRIQNLTTPSNIVVFLEQGLPGEERAHPTIAKKDYDGAPKGNAKSFVARYKGKGIVAMLDGSARDVSGSDLLTETGDIKWTSGDETQIRWTLDPKDDPNSKPGEGGTGTTPR